MMDVYHSFVGAFFFQRADVIRLPQESRGFVYVYRGQSLVSPGPPAQDMP